MAFLPNVDGGVGYVGLETSANLQERGVEVEAVELVTQIVPPLDPELTRGFENYIKNVRIRLSVGTSVGLTASPSHPNFRAETP